MATSSDEARFCWLEQQVMNLGHKVIELTESLGEMREYSVRLEYEIAKSKAAASGNSEILAHLIALQEYLKKSSKAHAAAKSQSAATYKAVIGEK